MKKESGKKITEKISEINPAKEDLTAEKLKSFPGLQMLSDESAKETVFALQTFASILYDFVNEQGKIKNLNEPSNTNQSKIAA